MKNCFPSHSEYNYPLFDWIVTHSNGNIFKWENERIGKFKILSLLLKNWFSEIWILGKFWHKLRISLNERILFPRKFFSFSDIFSFSLFWLRIRSHQDMKCDFILKICTSNLENRSKWVSSLKVFFSLFNTNFMCFLLDFLSPPCWSEESWNLVFLFSGSFLFFYRFLPFPTFSSPSWCLRTFLLFNKEKNMKKAKQKKFITLRWEILSAHRLFVSIFQGLNSTQHQTTKIKRNYENRAQAWVEFIKKV